MQAAIMAGGPGARLKSVISEIPKPMAPVLGKPFLERLILMLKEKGIYRFVFCVGHLAHKIEEYFGDGKKFGVEIKYSYEDTPLYSAGALKKAENLLDENFFMINGDDYADMDYKTIFSRHKENAALITIAGKKINDQTKGVSHTFISEDEKVTNYYSDANESPGNAGGTGVFLINKELLKNLKEGTPISLEKDLIDKHVKQGKVFSFISDSYFIDIGTPENYEKFIQDIKEKRI